MTRLAVLALAFLCTSGFAAAEGPVVQFTFNRCTGHDATGNGNDAKLTGNATCRTSIEGNAGFDFDATSYFTAQSSADMDVTDAVTYTAWVNPDSLGSTAALFRKWVGGYEDKDLSLQANGQIAFYLWNCMNGQPLLSRHKIPAGSWSHVVATYDDAIARIFIDGQLDSSEPTRACAVANNSGSLYLAIDPENPSEKYVGQMDDFRIYRRSLSASEIRKLYDAEVPPDIAGRVGWQTTHTVSCQNITQGTQLTLPPTKDAAWDCEAAGLAIDPGDQVRVTIDGAKY